MLYYVIPALKRWAKLYRAYGAAFMWFKVRVSHRRTNGLVRIETRRRLTNQKASQPIKRWTGGRLLTTDH
jgi:hypothetical protein